MDARNRYNRLTLEDIRAAQQRIAPAVVRTPLVRLQRDRLRAAGFTALANHAADIYLKDESAQPIGSFKLRGAYNRIAQLSAAELQRGVVTYSSGNHAQGVAYAARALGAKAVIVMPSNTPLGKLHATSALGAEIILVGPESSARKARAEELANLRGYTIIPPYDDEAIIAGQATCGLEILDQLPDVDLVLSPVSGGGLLSGVSAAVKLAAAAKGHAAAEFRIAAESHAAPEGRAAAEGHAAAQVWGCEPELAGDAKESFDSKKLVEWPAEKTTRTLADGLRTQSLGERNFPLILRYADGIVTVSEDEIRQAARVILTATDLKAEPSGAVALAAALFHTPELPAARQVVAILSGGNLEPSLRQELEAEAAAPSV